MFLNYRVSRNYWKTICTLFMTKFRVKEHNLEVREAEHMYLFIIALIVLAKIRNHWNVLPEENGYILT